jgi:hypothetical protein
MWSASNEIFNIIFHVQTINAPACIQLSSDRDKHDENWGKAQVQWPTRLLNLDWRTDKSPLYIHKISKTPCWMDIHHNTNALFPPNSKKKYSHRMRLKHTRFQAPGEWECVHLKAMMLIYLNFLIGFLCTHSKRAATISLYLAILLSDSLFINCWMIFWTR